MKNKHKIVNTIGLTALGSLVMLGLITIAPTVSNSASAESLTSSLSTKTTASLYSMLSLSLSDSIDINLTPKSVGTLEVGKAEVRVSTNNTTGYSIYLSTVDGTNSLNAVNQNQHYEGEEGTDYSIKALPTSTTADAYLDNSNNLNTWGYALTSTGGATSSTTYKGLASTAGDTIYTTRSTSSNDVYDLNIAVAVDASLPAGDYRNGIVVSAVANPIEIRGFNEIYYMQEMTPDICSRASVGDEGQLVDKRDHTIYWVAKLADDNCWMTQNLDLDLSTEVALTPEDSDVTAEWYPEASTNELPVQDSQNYPTDFSYSWDFGKIVLTRPNAGESCGDKISSNQVDISEVCPNLAVNVEKDWQPGFVAQSGKFNNAEGYVTVNQTDKTYDAHYLVGNYYRINAITAGSFVKVNDNELRANDSICPKGWKLPVVEREASPLVDTNGSYLALLMSYGYPSDPQDWSHSSSGKLETKNITGSDIGQDIYRTPLYFGNFGIISYNQSYVGFFGQSSVYPSSHGSINTAIPSGSNFYSLYFNSTIIRPINSDGNPGAVVARCLAK